MSRSSGQQLAFDQIEEISALSDRAISIVDVVEPADDSPRLKVTISLSTRHHARADGGLPVRKRERVILSIPGNFPRDYPWVDLPHKRFAGYSHVQWTTHVCLYRSPDVEWLPRDGMYGFIDRLNKWFGAAALGELDPDDAPLHPPVVSPSGNFRIVVRENTPTFDGKRCWIGTAELKPIHDTRFDLIQWRHAADSIDAGSIAAATILLNDPFPMEYPNSVRALVKQLETHGLKLVDLYVVMTSQLASLGLDQPLFVVLGTPMRRRDPNGPLRQHLAIWRINAEAVTALRAIQAGGDNRDDAIEAFVQWSFDASVEWCRVDEAREEVTLSRDTGSAMTSARGKRILLLGCGALGSHVADTLVRAGVASIKIVDKAIVTSGVLVRQQYNDAEIGHAKASATRDRLQKIAPHCDVTIGFEDLKYGVLSKLGRDFDVIIDATASRAVAEALEEDLRNDPAAPSILAMSVSARAQFGRVVVRRSPVTGGPKSIIRNAQIACFSNPTRAKLARAFWPQPGKVDLFQPEPGCSEPTFQASAADMAYHAAGLVNLGFKELANEERAGSLVAFLPNVTSEETPKLARLNLLDPIRHKERNHGHDVFVSQAAAKGIAAEVSRASRTLGPDVETGGLMFGEIDDSLGLLHLDAVTGPPPDSVHSPKLFLCGTDGTRERSELEKRRSGGASRFIGIWHTHPVSPPNPSDVDLGAMQNILQISKTPPRHTVMLIIGHASTDPEWGIYLYRRGELDFGPRRVRIVVRSRYV
ncbi:hypothetical protein GN278_01255 [Rhodobacteraceae bacterium Araon29]